MCKLGRLLNGILMISLVFSQAVHAESPEQICASASEIQNQCASAPADTIAAVIPTSRNPSQTLYNIVTAWRKQGKLGQVVADEISRILSAQVSVVGAQQALTKGKDKRKNELALVNLCVKQVSSLCDKMPVATPAPASTPCGSADCITQIRDTIKTSYAESAYATLSIDERSISFPSTPEKAYLKILSIQTLSKDGEPTAEISKIESVHFIIGCIAIEKEGCSLVTERNLELYSSKFSEVNLASLPGAKVKIRDVDSASNWGIDSDDVEKKLKNNLPTKSISVIAPLAAVFSMSRVSSNQSSLAIGTELARTLSDSVSLNVEVSGAKMGSSVKAAPANSANAQAAGCNSLTGTGCPEGLVCNYAGQCREADCTYSYIWGDSCPAPLHCELGQCRECSSDSHCGTGKVCRLGTCTPGNCNDDRDCGRRQSCENHQCVEAGCNWSSFFSDCPAGFVCDLLTNECKRGVCSSDVDCGCNEHCGDTPDGTKCLPGGCYIGVWPACMYGCHQGDICDESGEAPRCRPGCDYDSQCPHCQACDRDTGLCKDYPQGCPPGCDNVGGNSGCGPGKTCCDAGLGNGGECKTSCDTPTATPTPQPEETTAPTPEPTASVEPTVGPEESPVATPAPEETEEPQVTPSPAPEETEAAQNTPSPGFTPASGCGSGNCRDCDSIEEAVECCQFNNGSDCSSGHICDRQYFTGCPQLTAIPEVS